MFFSRTFLVEIWWFLDYAPTKSRCTLRRYHQQKYMVLELKVGKNFQFLLLFFDISPLFQSASI